MGRLNFQDIAGALVKPADNSLELPLATLLVIAEHLLAPKRWIINPHQPILGQHEGITREAFVNHINFVATLHGGKLCLLNQFANVVHPGVAGSINFNHI